MEYFTSLRLDLREFIEWVIAAANMATGYLDNNGDPYIKIEVANPLKWKSELDCLIDTGFTGCLSIPMLKAFPIGLLLSGTMSVTLADRSIQHKLTCLGSAAMDTEAKVGLILIEPQGEQVLLGMDFLRKFEKKLITDPIDRIVELVPALPSVPALPT